MTNAEHAQPPATATSTGAAEESSPAGADSRPSPSTPPPEMGADRNGSVGRLVSRIEEALSDCRAALRPPDEREPEVAAAHAPDS